ncbi:MAG: hypothetical protein IKE36_03075 [Solobacterium sp.]|nr:hypothetical protein [Solobacterium sp.]
MKILRVVTVLASLLLMTGCTTAQAIQETPSPTFSSAGKEVITETKKAAKTIQEEAIKAAEKASEEMAKKDDADQEKETSSEGKNNPEPSKPSDSQGTPKSDPVPERHSDSVPEPEPKPEPVPEPTPVPQPTPEPEPAPTPEPTPPPAPPQACPGGKDPSVGCDVILDTNYYHETFSSYSEAMSKGQYYMDEVMYIGDIEITSYSVQEVYRNDHSIAYYGLNLWSNGSLIQ